MSDHYYSKKPASKSDPIEWSSILQGEIFYFKTDHGVFSRKEVDYGSKLLIHTFHDPPEEGPILDVGCGYGPIGLALAKTFQHRFIHMIDINERALKLAEENAIKNQIDNISIYESDSLNNVRETFAAIVTNPPIRAGKSVVFDILEKSYDHLKTGGELWIVVQRKQGAPSIRKKVAEIYGEAQIVKKDKGYYVIFAKKN